MSELRIEEWSLPAADLGPENPLPPLRSERDVHASIDAGPDIPKEMLRYMAYGRVPGILPYTMQDGYTRRRQERAFRVAVLENETLRAAFFLELGGRLWSLVHKPSGRELLDANPVFQPANLALRNAWFSGGVEWNICTTGHWPLTCSPLFAARVERPDGTPVLRLYEWERIRQVPFQIDAYLPGGSPVLHVRIRIVNPHDREVPMYWWSNMAVPETPDTRVVVPADATYRFGYKRSGLRRIPVPRYEDLDFTYPTNLDHSADFFFDIPAGQRPWIAALDGGGRGLVQVSTERLRGRKLFLWGMGAGGRKWQTFLSQSGEAYIEIQAGLARTQMEHLPMPARAEWSWLEAYGLMEAEPAAVHGADWSTTRQSVAEALERLVPRAALDAEHAAGAAWADRPPAELFQHGSGWGALERLRREARDEPSFCPAGFYDDASLGEAQAPWIGLLYDGAMPALDPDAEPPSYMVQAEWRASLEDAVSAGRGAHWLAWLHLGVMRYHAGDHDGARRAWEASLAQSRTPWALRNLAVLAQQEGRLEDAAERYVDACRMRPSLLPLAVECGRALIDADRPRAWLELLAELPLAVRGVGRVRLLEAQAALALGDYASVKRIFALKPVVDDMREGELSLSQLWFAYHERRTSAAENVPIDDALRARVRRDFPVPAEFDFRMRVDESFSS